MNYKMLVIGSLIILVTVGLISTCWKNSWGNWTHKQTYKKFDKQGREVKDEKDED